MDKNRNARSREYPFTAQFTLAILEERKAETDVMVTVQFQEGRFSKGGVEVHTVSIDGHSKKFVPPLKNDSDGTVDLPGNMRGKKSFLVIVSGIDHKGRPFLFSKQLRVEKKAVELELKIEAGQIFNVANSPIDDLFPTKIIITEKETRREGRTNVRAESTLNFQLGKSAFNLGKDSTEHNLVVKGRATVYLKTQPGAHPVKFNIPDHKDQQINLLFIKSKNRGKK